MQRGESQQRLGISRIAQGRVARCQVNRPAAGGIIRRIDPPDQREIPRCAGSIAHPPANKPPLLLCRPCTSSCKFAEVASPGDAATVPSAISESMIPATLAGTRTFAGAAAAVA